jgi:sulfur carrier protein
MNTDAEHAVQITFNGEAQALRPMSTLADLLRRMGEPPQGSATAVNGEFVAQSQRQEWMLKTGDQVTSFQVIVGG